MNTCTHPQPQCRRAGSNFPSLGAPPASMGGDESMVDHTIQTFKYISALAAGDRSGLHTKMGLSTKSPQQDVGTGRREGLFFLYMMPSFTLFDTAQEPTSGRDGLVQGTGPADPAWSAHDCLNQAPSDIK